MKIGKLELLKCQGFDLVEKDGKTFIFADVEKTRLFHSKESGRIYMDLVMFETPNSEYSDYAVSESKTKEEIEDKELKLPIVGNFKNWKQKEEETNTTEQGGDLVNKDDLPF